jgi:hypothetical protein
MAHDEDEEQQWLRKFYDEMVRPRRETTIARRRGSETSPAPTLSLARPNPPAATKKT